MRKSMTYGTLPSKVDFEVAFWEVCGNKADAAIKAATGGET